MHKSCCVATGIPCVGLLPFGIVDDVEDVNTLAPQDIRHRQVRFMLADKHNTSCHHVRSTSMADRDRRPLVDAPVTELIQQHADNRLGAVYSALYSFWSARNAAVAVGQRAAGARRDAYSVILFDKRTKNVLVNDFTSTPEQLLGIVLDEGPSYGTNFTAALEAAGAVMERNWSPERHVI